MLLREVRTILASTSRYRRELLQRLTDHIEQHAPKVDETADPGEHPKALALRLASAKAQALSVSCSDALIIGSDQVACCDATILGKPGNHARAVAQLQQCSGNTVTFYTAISVIDTRSRPFRVLSECNETRVTFRNLSNEEIHAYLMREQAYDCAGSFKCEGLGIALFERIQTEDPTALIGLPLIALTNLLREFGIRII